MPPEDDKPTKTEEQILPLELNKSNSDVMMFFEPLEVSTDNLAEDVNIQFDKDEFVRGLKDSSYFAGMYTGLINVGFSMEDSVALIFNRMNIENNISVSKISADSSIEVSRNVSNAKDHDSL